MSLLQRIESDLHDAIKSKDDIVLRTLRMLKSDIMYEKTKGEGELPEEKVLEIVTRASKKRKEAIVEFDKAGRDDLSEREKEELLVIEKYLPEQLGEEDASAIIDRIIRDMGEVSKKDFGKVMGPVMKELKGKIDRGIVKRLLTEKL
ncbi:MAG TPA: GatB/YqeY domain-containing protein, partial [Spirochaetota bacterium]|nr:GatB/YqeY domain-containing protein [Spirochaetota bacterium]